MGRATLRQTSKLLEKGYPYSLVDSLSFDEARDLIGRIKANGWKPVDYYQPSGEIVSAVMVEPPKKRRAQSDYRRRKDAAKQQARGKCQRCSLSRGRAFALPGKESFAVLCKSCRDLVVIAALSEYVPSPKEGE